MLMSRRGRHYPNPEWAAWRDDVVSELSMMHGDLFDTPVRMKVVYTPNDLKRRDMPAMLDSIFHIMEKAGLIKDDFLVKDLTWVSWPKDTENSGASIFIEEI